MRTPEAPWSTQRLGEFLVFLSLVKDEASAIRVAVERAASALEAEVAALLGPDSVIGSVGFAVGQVPSAQLLEAATGRRKVIDVPGAGPCHVTVVALNRHNQGYLLVARSGDEGFTVHECGLLRGMARALELTIETQRTLAAEREQAARSQRLLESLQQRQRLLEQISEIQRAITRRVPQQDVLDSITRGAHRLLGDDVVALWIRDPDDPTMLLLASHRGLSCDLARRLWRICVDDAGCPGQALIHDELVVISSLTDVVDLTSSRGRCAQFVSDGITTSMAAPVHESGVAVGSLEVASRKDGRNYSETDQEILSVFAGHVSLAVTDARTHEAMRQAFHDPLTGLASRRLFSDQLDHALVAATASGMRIAVLFLDLDRFKMVNDSLGHAAGDSLLVSVANRVRSCIRDGDIAARLGGDEFAVILVDLTGEASAVHVAQRIIESVRKPFLVDGKEVFVDASIGIALNGAGVRSGQSLLSNADLAMYQAKRNGRGRYEVFEPGLRKALMNKRDLESDLRYAVEREELVLYYQPVVNLASEKTVGVEALLRWHHPRRGLIMPRDFIPLAEESGLITSLETWALTVACQQVSDWNQLLGTSTLTLSVNLSIRQIQRADLADVILRALLATGICPDKLILEIEESLFLRGGEAILGRLQKLHDLRVRLAIDDFGTGYSSFAYLRHLPIHMIKIDKSFVGEMGNCLPSSRLAKAIVQMGRTLDIVTLAEGIEARDQLEILRECGCQLGQGFYFAKPLIASDLESLVLNTAG